MSGDEPSIPDALLEVELERLEASESFRRSPNHLRMLRYLVHNARAGRGARLKESVIAVEVMGRSASRFDSRHDTAVRVTIGRLRQRLARYYAAEGAWASVEIAIPVGSYQPVFTRRPQNGGPKLPSIAVLPFVNFTGLPAREVFCDSLSEEITDALAQVPGVKVVARTSAFRFRGVVADVRTIGQALGVATLLEGSVQMGPEGRLKVVAQWVRAVDGYHAWSFIVEAPADENDQAFQQRVARDIVAGLHRRLLQAGSVHSVTTSSPTIRRSHNGAAQGLYNDGRYLLRLESVDGYRRAIDVLRQATVTDPEFALAHCALGRALVNVVGMTVAPANGLLTGARQSLARALGIDPELGEAHALSGFIACAFDRDWGSAERSHLRGIRGAPSLPYAHSSYAWGLMMNGRFAEADTEFRFARDLDPLDLKMRAHHALLSLYAGDDARAIGELEAIVAVEPAHVIARVALATACLWTGDTERAEALFCALLRAYPTLTIGDIGMALVEAQDGRQAAARARLARLLAGGGKVHLPPYQVAMIYARLGDDAAALSWLRRAATQRDLNFVCAPLDRTFAPLRGNPQFAKLLQRYGLQPIWTASPGA